MRCSPARPAAPCGGPCTTRAPRVHGSIKGNSLVLQGDPFGQPDMSMSVKNDEFVLKYGRCVLMKVAAEGTDILDESTGYAESLLEIVRETVFRERVGFDGCVSISGTLVVDGPSVLFKNLRRVTDTSALLRLYVDPCSGEIVAGEP